MRRTIRLCVAGALVASVVAGLPVAADSHFDTVLTGVDNPRGLTIDDNGDLFVAASGSGGTTPCTEAPEGGQMCYGDTGHIHDVRDVSAAAGLPRDAEGEILVDNLPSLAAEGGAHASGPADVHVSGGRLYFTVGLGADPAVRSTDLSGATGAAALATLQSVQAADGTDPQQVADLGQHEADDDPDDAGADTNPFGVVATDDAAYVLDAGGNTMVQVDLPGGTTSTHTVFPPTLVPAPGFLPMPHGSSFPAQAVPTQLALRDGSFDVGQLTGFPFHPGSASVWHVDDSPTVRHTGFTNIMDVAWHDGDLYVLEIFHDGLLNGGNGALVRVRTDGGTVTRELLMDDLPTPGGMAFDPTDPGMLYVSTGSSAPDGSVIRFDATALDPLVTVVDDTATTDEDERLVAGSDAEADAYQSVASDVADNDDGVTSVAVIDNSQGAVYDGSIVYQPPAHFTGEDTVTYRGCDDGRCLIGVLTITVEEDATDRIAGGTRIQTAIEAAQGRYPQGAPVVVLARADLYPDALAGGPLARAADGPILLTSRDDLEDDVAAEITRLGAAKVYLLGGPVALAEEVEDAVEALPTVAETVRVEGDDRFATAVAIRDELATVAGADADHAYVVEGADPDPTRGWPDAVAVSALASFEGRPILLVETERLPEATAAALQDVDATIIGGPVAVGAAVTAGIEDAAGAVDRVQGATRYETSRLVAERSFEAGLSLQVLTLVSGGNWPDALVAGPLVAKSTGAFLLVHPTDLTQGAPTLRFMDDHGPFADVDLFGGTAAISTEVEAGIAAANGG